MKRILFPTDFSEAATNAFTYANAFASAQGAVIDLIHIFHIPISDSGNVLPEYIEDLIEQGEKEALRELENLTLPYKGSATVGSKKAIYGLFTGIEIIDYAKKGNYDLLLMGTKGERSSLEKWMGSITTEVMMKAPCPVLAIPAKAAFDTIDNIAYATAFDPGDQPAVEQLLNTADQLHAQLHFVHVNTNS
ncbi:MAG: universal stress protein, partial [Phaeodactylibacter sp.]|nr:universal stress protein [Phaeodactylibacter sp.]